VDDVANNANGAGAGKRPFRILLVCEANVCRSPMAEYLLRQSLADKGADAAVFELSSAGTHADDGAEMYPRTVEQLVRLNVFPNGFRSHTVTAHDLDDADLILTATRAQRSMLLGGYRPRCEVLSLCWNSRRPLSRCGAACRISVPRRTW